MPDQDVLQVAHACDRDQGAAPAGEPLSARGAAGIVRAARPHGDGATRRARELLERISLLHLDDVLLDAAADLAGETLRSIDAIHLAAARALGPSLTEIITYDDRMAKAAKNMNLVVSAPRDQTKSH